MLSSYILRMSGFGDAPAIVEQGAFRAYSYSYRELVERARAFAGWLRSKGISPKDGREPPRVLLWATPGAGWAIAFYGCVLAGAVAVPIDAGFSPSFVHRIAEHTRAALLVTRSSFLNAFDGTQQQNWETFTTEQLQDLPPSDLTGNPGAPISRDSLVEIVYTSGTTAEPRGVMITHGNLLANIEPIEREIHRYEKWMLPFRPIRFLHLIPLSHLFGQVMGLFLPQLLGGVVVFPETQAPARLARIIHDRKISAMVSVPQQLEAFTDWARARVHPDTNGSLDALIGRASAEHWPVLKRWWHFRHLHSLLGWKMWAFIVGGAALPSRLEQFWSTLGYAVVQGYGLTETAPAITVTHPFKIRRGSVGRPLPGVETRIAEDGEILVRGPNVSPGYYRDTASTQEEFQGGWLHTGDLGKFDEQGNLIYLGRKKEMIVTAEGLNVFPEDVENVLREQPSIADAAVVGKNTSAGAESASARTTVHAVLIPAPGASQNDLDIAVNNANNALEPHQRIRGFSVWPENSFPRTLSTSKLQRAKIAAWVNGQAATVPSSSEAGEAGDWKDLLIRLGTPPDRVRPDARLAEDLGLSSLDRVELLTWLETRGYSFDEAALAQARTIADLEKLIEEPSRGGPGTPSPEPAPTTEKGGQAPTPESKPRTSPAPGVSPEPRWPVSLPARAGREMMQEIATFPLLRFYVKLEVQGMEKLRDLREPALFISNHQSMFDVPLIVRSLPRRFRRRIAPAMGEDALRGHTEWTIFWARLGFNGYVISDDPARAQEALRHAGWLAEHGYSTLLFPEGGRTWDGSLQRFRPGVGLIAERLGMPVVPLLIQGLFELWPREQQMPSHGKARLTVGEITRIKPEESAGEFTRRLEDYYRSWMART